MGIWLFVIAILVVIMIHEAGHFLVAKAFDFKATKFFVGFGPTLWSFRRGETEYGVKALPLGGFVKIIGMNPYEEVPPEDEHRSYPNKPAWQRALVLVAGSATHWVVAFVLLLVTLLALGLPTGGITTNIESITTEISGTETPAVAAGIRPGDRVVAIDGNAIERWEDVSEYIRAHGPGEIAIEIEREGRRETVTAHLGTAVFSAEGEVVAYAAPGEPVPETEEGQTTGGFLGVSPEPEYASEGFVWAASQSGQITWEVTRNSVTGIGQVFGMVFGGDLWNALTGEGDRAIDEGPLGIVGAGRIASESVERGRYLDLVGLIVGFTIFVGLMNLLPLPPLDGGHLAVLAWEKVTGKNVDVRKLIPVAAAVISFFVVLFLAVLYLDLARPIEVPF